ncbi:MAG: hypothetical protein HKN43_12790 [Rhodothermales bacterium]|nr:hypothetical protein [Rhodothermales bacterium]
MATRERRGMVIKNTDTRPVTIAMTTRTIELPPGGEKPVTADEVKDGTLRDLLQVRAISIVRPTTAEEEEELAAELHNSTR